VVNITAAAGAFGFGSRLLPNTSDWYGRFRLAANAANDYGIDREVQRRNAGTNGFTGINGIGLQDQCVTESMGPIYDRSNERLGTSDSMIIRVRRRLLNAARALQHTPFVGDIDRYDSRELIRPDRPTGAGESAER